jgi:hypothetical protein
MVIFDTLSSFFICETTLAICMRSIDCKMCIVIQRKQFTLYSGQYTYKMLVPICVVYGEKYIFLLCESVHLICVLCFALLFPVETRYNFPCKII